MTRECCVGLRLDERGPRRWRGVPLPRDFHGFQPHSPTANLDTFFTPPPNSRRAWSMSRRAFRQGRHALNEISRKIDDRHCYTLHSYRRTEEPQNVNEG